MVFFVCEGCNESLKKNKVDAHAVRCRNCWAVTCVDCSKTFEGDDYRQHTTCISEAEKYEGVCYQGNKKTSSQTVKKGATIQEKWNAAVQSATSADRHTGPILSQIQMNGHVPRKKAKFVNYMKNSLRIHDITLVNTVWAIFEEELEKYKETAVDPPKTDSEATSQRRPSKKRKTESIKWSKVIRKNLKAAPGRTMRLKALKKLVLNSAKETQPDVTLTTDEFKEQLNLLMPRIQLDGKHVTYAKRN